MKLETFQAKPIGVTKKKNESVQGLISRFKKVVGESNILIDYNVIIVKIEHELTTNCFDIFRRDRKWHSGE